MGWYEALKDGISVAQKADNLPLVKDLLDAQQQIFDLVNENNQLKEEIKRLKEVANIELNIERHKDAYITLKNDSEKLIYCSCCWDTKKMLVKGQVVNTGKYQCPSCKTTAYYDRAAYNKSQVDAISSMGRGVRY